MTAKYLLGLVGHPVAKSLSPPMHKAALQFCNLEGTYELFDIPGENLLRQVNRLKEKGLSGFNVTIPHKTAILQSCVQLSPSVRRVGAANTIKVQSDGSLSADNTDIGGFSAALTAATNISHLHTACILGAGGASKAAIDVLLQLSFKKIFILARDSRKASALCQEWTGTNETRAKLIPVAFSEHNTISGAQLFVSTIPYGQTVALDSNFLTCLFTDCGNDNAFIFDMVYSRDGSDTSLVKLAKDLGRSACDGTAMLVHQASLAFTIWTGEKVPFAVMHDALVAARAKGSICQAASAIQQFSD